ncbi:MAG: RNA methyltransferase [Bacteroidales bacterium]|nr:RNA methyltransferase [Bacteroidales bacterium]
MRKLKISELKRKSVTEFRNAEKSGIVIILDNVRSLNNIGSIFRTADAFLVDHICLCGITATPPHRDIHKTALGATESVAWSHFSDTTDAIIKFKEEGYIIVSIEQVEGSVMLDRFNPEKGGRYALIFGHEVKGVTPEAVNMSDMAIEIPQFGTKHSFNIAVSAGIALWDIFRKMML